MTTTSCVSPDSSLQPNEEDDELRSVNKLWVEPFPFSSSCFLPIIPFSDDFSHKKVSIPLQEQYKNAVTKLLGSMRQTDETRTILGKRVLKEDQVASRKRLYSSSQKTAHACTA
jgi:hypothetical protein